MYLCCQIESVMKKLLEELSAEREQVVQVLPCRKPAVDWESPGDEGIIWGGAASYGRARRRPSGPLEWACVVSAQRKYWKMGDVVPGAWCF